MPNRIFHDYQGQFIRVDGDCYFYKGGTGTVPNSDQSEIEETYNSCLECKMEYSSSESEGNTSSSTSSFSSDIVNGDCTNPCELVIQFKTFTIPDTLKVYSNGNLVLNTGSISTGSSFTTYTLSDLECPIQICVNAPNFGTKWALIANGCGFNMSTGGGKVDEICWMSEEVVASTCPNSDPEMLVTVFDADYAGGDINWAGQTWTQAEVQAGTQKTACPSFYGVTQVSYALSGCGGSCTGTFRIAENAWTASYLVLKRRIQGFNDLGTYNFCNYGNYHAPGYWYNRLTAGTLNSFKQWSKAVTIPCVPGTLQGGSYNLGDKIKSVASPTFIDYAITPAFFGSHTISGVLYTWSKGNGWPV